MRVITPRRRDPRIRLATALKIERLQARIDRLIADDLAAHEREQLAAATDGVPRTAGGSRDRRTAAYRAWRAARDLERSGPSSGPPLALDTGEPLDPAADPA